jgi:DNA replication protein DnaC
MDFLQMLANRSKKEIPMNEGDYIKDNLIYCGKCHTPKQGRYKVGEGVFLTPRILCKCETEKRDREDAEVKERKRLLHIERLRKSGFQDDKLINYSFENDISADSKQSKAFRQYCDKWKEMLAENIGLLLFGDCGTGKSFYAGCIANEILNRYATPVVVTSIPRILNQLFNTENKNGYIHRLATVPLLILDDFGSERETDYALEQIFTVIDERYKAEKPIIITTNLSYEQLKNPADIRYKRIYDRIIEMTVPFNLAGLSLRNKKAEEKKAIARKLLFD